MVTIQILITSWSFLTLLPLPPILGSQEQAVSRDLWRGPRERPPLDGCAGVVEVAAERSSLQGTHWESTRPRIAWVSSPCELALFVCLPEFLQSPGSLGVLSLLQCVPPHRPGWESLLPP